MYFFDFSTISYEFSKFTKRNEKGLFLLQKRPWKVLKHCNWVLGRGQRWGRGLTGRIPARSVAGGEGQGAKEHERLKAHLMEGLGGARDGRRGLVGEEQSVAAGVLDGGGVPARERR